VKKNNQAFVDLMETIQLGESNHKLSGNGGHTKISIDELHIKKGYSCKINDILDFCKKIENGEVLEPIEVNQNNMIIDGVKRYFAHMRLKHNTIQVKTREVFIEEFIGERFKIIR
jgi:hypothetical protein